ncbi:excinuclease ABC subunit UvrA [Nocardiopsis lambiniae]|uniref:UvrABC system protein A n=1 Tax=Nocardiopsis lambiniae TaxID=3075539 RepID=A0ABU2M9W0_9ACTN|nr:excinuclease ABC subunit UvrA [Nocardiopsis sp. DSM 44743]MDT0329461.1 excinuclease ABC subunit UvrA [Nocardiopsis sp. DSM 44743]
MAEPIDRSRNAPPDLLRVRGARVHNLRDLDVDLPHRALVVVTGVSGSGKSSLVHGTVYAEAQRRHLQPLSAFTRRLVGGSMRPDVDSIAGVCAAVAVAQTRAATNPRSTVGTATNTHDHLRSLFAVSGSPDGSAGVPEMTARAFSFNSSAHACPTCEGLGTSLHGDPALVVDDPSRSLRDGVLRPWRDRRTTVEHELSLRFAESLGADPDRPWSSLDPGVRHRMLHEKGAELRAELTIRGQARVRDTRYVGVLPWLALSLRDASGEAARARATAFMSVSVCPDCRGGRLSPAQLSVLVAGRNIADVCRMEIADALAWTDEVAAATAGDPRAALGVAEIRGRLDDLVRVGVGYLTLDRPVPTLSGGEAQRVRLATHLGMEMFGLMYVFDEPSAGLHPRDTGRLLDALCSLRDQGNTVLVVEHDLDVIAAADWVIEIGPGPGVHGGRLIHSGPAAELASVAESVTAPYLSAPNGAGARPRSTEDPGWTFAGFTGAEGNNLRSVSVRFPMNAMTCVTGVSGAGKSSLVTHVLEPALAAAAGADDRPAPRCSSVSGLEGVTGLVTVGQAPIGRTPRSNAVTYLGVFDRLRKMFAATPEAAEAGLGPGDFSFNNAGGRCPACEGAGVVQVEMFFLPDVELPCETCDGARFSREPLRARVRGLDISEVLGLTAERAAEVFSDVKGVSGPLRSLVDVGLGYLLLGQPATTLSGGEAQRLKLARELSGDTVPGTVYLLDEPTYGLHAADVARLNTVLRRLVERGGTVVAVTHHAAVMVAADWIVELGDEGGAGGGKVVSQGVPARVARQDTHTGRVLARWL